MLKHLRQLSLIAIVALTLSGCAGQFVRRPPTVSYDPANGVVITTPTIGQVAAEVLRDNQGPIVYYHPGGRDFEMAPPAFDLEYERLSNGGYRPSVLLSIVPNGIAGALVVKGTNNSDRIAGPTERNGWAWRTKNHFDGAWRHYELMLRYANTQETLLFKYSVRSSPNPRVTGP